MNWVYDPFNLTKYLLLNTHKIAWCKQVCKYCKYIKEDVSHYYNTHFIPLSIKKKLCINKHSDKC